MAPRYATLPILAGMATGCADFPTIQLPLSTQFPVEEVQLGMTFGDLQRVRPDVMVVPDSAVVAEELPGGYARTRWDSLVVALAGELGVELRCTTIEYGRLNWRRATVQGDGNPLAGAVDVVGITIGDPGPGEAQLVTRIWLTEYVSPVSQFLALPEVVGRQLPAAESSVWVAC